MADNPYAEGWKFCPFCGKDTASPRTQNHYSKYADKSLDKSKTWWTIMCSNCYAQTAWYDVRVEAFHAWNRGEVKPRNEVIANV